MIELYINKSIMLVNSINICHKLFTMSTIGVHLWVTPLARLKSPIGSGPRPTESSHTGEPQGSS